MNILNSVRRQSPKAARAARLVREGNAANQSRSWADAAAAYAEALALDPNRAPIHVQHGHALKEQGFLAQAEQAYLRAARLDPASADTHLQIGHVLKLRNDTARAIAAYEAAHRLDPGMTHGRAELSELRALAPHLDVAADLHLRAPSPSGADRPPVPKSAEALLQADGLRVELLQQFDPYFYHQANEPVRRALPSPDRLTCLRHFCTHGIDLMLPVAAELRFDPAFYLETYLGGMAFTPGNAYRHWLGVGIGKGASPNRERWTQALLGGTAARLDGVDLALFAAQDDAQANERPWVRLAQRFFDQAGDPARPCPLNEHDVHVFHHIATRLERGDAGQAERAFRLRQMIADRIPGFRPNLAGLAALLQRRGCWVEAAQIYRAAEAEGFASSAGRLGLAGCEAALGQPEQALRTVHRACGSSPGDQGLRWQRIDHAERLLAQAWAQGIALARMGRIGEGQAAVARACAAICETLGPVPRTERPPPRAIRRIALAGHAPLPQCRFYRIDQTAELLEDMGYEVIVIDLATEPGEFHEALHGLDAVIFCRVPATPIAVAAIEAADSYGLATFYDMDDLIFDPAYPDPIDSYGGLISRDEHAGLALAVPLFDAAMRLCSYGIASTPPLAEAMRLRVGSGRVLVRQNALGRPHMDFLAAAGMAQPKEAPVTLFYGSGGKAHKADFQLLVEPALVALAQRHGPKVAIVLMGEFPETEALRSIGANVTILPPVWDVNAYWSILAGTDINLAVLLQGPANDAKSAIKWLEAAMLGIPAVVSDTATYRAVVRAGETALVCGTARDWTDALDRLVQDEALRRRIGANAREQAMSEFAGPVVAAALDGFVREVSPPEDARPLVVIAHVFYPPQAVGGATRVVRDNVRDVTALAGERLRVEVFACLDGGPPYGVSSDAEDGIRVTRVGSPDAPDVEHRVTDERMGEIFGAYLDRTRPALVHFHCIQRLTGSIVSATAARGIPYLVTAHDGWWISEHQFLLDADGQARTYDMARPIVTLQLHGAAAHARLSTLRRALLGARQVLAVSAPFAALYRECGVPNVVTVENGVPELADPSRAARTAGPAGKVRLGFIGGLARHKGYDLMRIAVEARPWRNLRLLLIDHAMESGTERHETWGSVPVEVRPKWPQADVAALYGQIDVLMAPSIWPESYGLVTREAISAGCFVVTSDRGSMGACVDEGLNGFVVDVGSPDGLIGALAQLDAEPERFGRSPPPPPPMRRAADQAAEIVAIYDSILAEASPAATWTSPVRALSKRAP